LFLGNYENGVTSLVTPDKYKKKLSQLKPPWEKIDEVVDDLIQNPHYQKHRRLMNQLKGLKSGKRRLAYSVTGTEPEIKYPFGTYFKIHADYDRWLDSAEIQSGLVKLGNALAELHHIYHELDNLYRSLRKQQHKIDDDHWRYIYDLTSDQLDL
jgi:hypothetical protein